MIIYLVFECHDEGSWKEDSFIVAVSTKQLAEDYIAYRMKESKRRKPTLYVDKIDLVESDKDVIDLLAKSKFARKVSKPATPVEPEKKEENALKGWSNIILNKPPNCK